ncbi:DHA2 family efflux MFS transporter permease subunit [Pararobbsia silviterrae]|uniref:DHA2 family efflux MFS transporter permease subunit n=1 Tax=Pararobbsia silviterrae TaxID=1792498 RepID=A0A494YF53_9BURK|nr:DHA2 family efflux MFS transporter permease subunit [Pararobbsia silviterrae]RKP58677.1 DHA2 family efflux MFS transporter permease subunit [Pararobbsia silviterrae]
MNATHDAPETLTQAGMTSVALLVAGTFFMENLDGTVITPAIPQMAASFAVPPVALNTGVSAYMLTLGIFIPVSGWIADRFGARKVFASAIALFTLASLLCALAPTLSTFVLTRILQGIGGAMMVPVGRLVVLRVTPKERLIHAIAMLTWPALVAPVLGPPLGGWLSEHANWRWIFWLNLPLGVVACGLAWILVPRARGNRALRFDWTGFVLSGAALFCLLYVAELLGRAHIAGFEALALAVVGVALLVSVARHLKRTPHPMVDLASLDVPTFAVTIWGGSLFRMGVSAVPFLLPLMFQIGFGYDAFKAGALLMAVFAGNLAMKPMTTSILKRFGFRRVLIVNGLLNAATIAACATVGATMPLALVCVILFLSGMTRSMQFTALNTVAFADIEQTAMAAANTLFSAAFQLAMGLGIALAAIAWRVGGLVATAGASPAAPFRVAFLIVAGAALIGVWDSVRLNPRAGEHVARRAGKKA